MRVYKFHLLTYLLTLPVVLGHQTFCTTANIHYSSKLFIALEDHDAMTSQPALRALMCFGAEIPAPSTQTEFFKVRNPRICASLISTGGFCCCALLGVLCEVENQLTDACDPNPCEAGGTCVSLASGDVLCRCPEDRDGEFCQLRELL